MELHALTLAARSYVLSMIFIPVWSGEWFILHCPNVQAIYVTLLHFVWKYGNSVFYIIQICKQERIRTDGLSWLE